MKQRFRFMNLPYCTFSCLYSFQISFPCSVFHICMDSKREYSISVAIEENILACAFPEHTSSPLFFVLNTVNSQWRLSCNVGHEHTSQKQRSLHVVSPEPCVLLQNHISLSPPPFLQKEIDCSVLIMIKSLMRTPASLSLHQSVP